MLLMSLLVENLGDIWLPLTCIKSIPKRLDRSWFLPLEE